MLVMEIDQESCLLLEVFDTIWKNFSDHPPENAKELFNLRHSSLRTTTEREFGVIKKHFRVLDAEPF